MGRQAYVRTGGGDWRRIDAGAGARVEERGVSGFEAVDGFSLSDLYAAGRRGQVHARFTAN
jgi:hypothetical protein